MTESAVQWQALPRAAIVALYVSGVVRTVRENVYAFAGAGTGFAISDSLGWREFGLVALAVLLGGMLFAMIYHRRFRYAFDDAAIRVRKGLFEQQEVKVRFERVQNVSISTPFYLRPLGLVRVALETPGAAQTEVKLPDIAPDQALWLRDRIGESSARTAGSSADADAAEPSADGKESPAEGELAFRPGAANLFRYGLTSSQIWIFVAAVGAPLSNWIENHVDAAIEQGEAMGWIDPGALTQAPLLAALIVIALVLALALALMVLSGLISVVRFHGFALVRDGLRLRARHGLLETREKSLKLARLHSVTLAQSALGRWLGQWHVIAHQAGVEQLHQIQGGDRRFLIPGIEAGRLGDVAGMLFDRAWSPPDWRPVSRRYRSFLWTRIGIPLLLLAVALWQLVGSAAPWLALVALAINLFLLVVVALVWRRWGWALDGQFLRIRQGMIGQKISAFDLERCQQIRIRTSPYQRRHGLATLVFRLPHGEQELPFIARADADRLLNLTAWRIERALSHAL